MNTSDIVVANTDGVAYDPYVSPSARARQARALDAVTVVNQGDNPSLDAASREHERIATDETAIDNLRAAKSAGENPAAWYDPYDPWENP